MRSSRLNRSGASASATSTIYGIGMPPRAEARISSRPSLATRELPNLSRRLEGCSLYLNPYSRQAAIAYCLPIRTTASRGSAQARHWRARISASSLKLFGSVTNPELFVPLSFQWVYQLVQNPSTLADTCRCVLGEGYYACRILNRALELAVRNGSRKYKRRATADPHSVKT